MVKVNISGCDSFVAAADYQNYVQKALAAFDTLQAENGAGNDFLGWMTLPVDIPESLIKEFRLEKVRKNNGDRLSGGERRRTEIARCLAISPKFIMLDEPFAGVDPIAVEDIQYIVWKLKDKNIGILITDHNVEETLCITDRAYLLFEGRILFQGTPEELAENQVVRDKYLTNSFKLRKKDFQNLR